MCKHIEFEESNGIQLATIKEERQCYWRVQAILKTEGNSILIERQKYFDDTCYDVLFQYHKLDYANHPKADVGRFYISRSERGRRMIQL